jgi:hypothetical protein
MPVSLLHQPRGTHEGVHTFSFSSAPGPAVMITFQSSRAAPPIRQRYLHAPIGKHREELGRLAATNRSASATRAKFTRPLVQSHNILTTLDEGPAAPASASQSDVGVVVCSQKRWVQRAGVDAGRLTRQVDPPPLA